MGEGEGKGVGTGGVRPVAANTQVYLFILLTQFIIYTRMVSDKNTTPDALDDVSGKLTICVGMKIMEWRHRFHACAVR